MKKSSIPIILILLFTYEIITHSYAVINCVKYSYQIWINSLMPSLFPFFIVSNLLINYGFVEFVSELTKPIFCKLFKINSNASFIFIMSLLSGLPSNAKYTKELYEENKLTKKEATKILMFTHFANPLFILGTISITFLNNKQLGIIVMISHYLGNIILGIILRNYYPTITNEKLSLKNLNLHNKRINNKQPIGKIISTAILSTIDTLLLILGVVTIFLIITTIIFQNFNLPPNLKAFISCLLEMTQGLKYISELDINDIYKTILISASISFGGLSVHMQVASIISDTKIKYKPFLIARILHALISSIICYFILKLYI